MDNFYAVIMAGGGGTRLWPLSRKDRPKQLLKLVDGKSMFQIAMERLQGLMPIERIYIATAEAQMEALKAEYPSIPEGNFILEPQPKGTAAVVGLAAVHLQTENTDAVMAILTADHIIENQALFHSLLGQANEAAQSGHLVTLGIDPTYPATGYGYIQAGDEILTGKALRVVRFVEKPDEDTAKGYLASGGYYWNSGMFIWRADAILDEFERQMPELYSTLKGIQKLLLQPDAVKFNALWQTIEPQTIDYGIMENARNVVVLPAIGLGWSDVGSWDSLFDFLSRDENGNVCASEPILNLGSTNTLVSTEV